jgi:hypothetical protein
MLQKVLSAEHSNAFLALLPVIIDALLPHDSAMKRRVFGA